MHVKKSPLLWVPSGYFTMALTYVTLTSVSAIMFKNLGMDNGRAAEYASYLILAYTIKPLFAPLVEMYRSKKFFVICTQLLLGLGFITAALLMTLGAILAIELMKRFAPKLPSLLLATALDGSTRQETRTVVLAPKLPQLLLSAPASARPGDSILIQVSPGSGTNLVKADLTWNGRFLATVTAP